MLKKKANDERRKLNEFQKKNRMNEEAFSANHADKIEKHLGKNYIAQVEDGGHISVIHKNAKSFLERHMRFMSTEVTQKLFILRLARQRVR